MFRVEIAMIMPLRAPHDRFEIDQFWSIPRDCGPRSASNATDPLVQLHRYTQVALRRVIDLHEYGARARGIALRPENVPASRPSDLRMQHLCYSVTRQFSRTHTLRLSSTHGLEFRSHHPWPTQSRFRDCLS